MCTPFLSTLHVQAVQAELSQTDVRDMVYAFYGLTHNTTFPNYEDCQAVGLLYVEICHIYINSILWDAAYSSWHELDDQRKVFQLMSILYSAGILQHSLEHELPSWVPDWTFAVCTWNVSSDFDCNDWTNTTPRNQWHLAPIWIKTTPNFITARPKDDWTAGVRSAYRAGGDEIETFAIREGSRHQLKLSALVFDSILLVNEMTPASTPGAPEHDLSTSPSESWDSNDPANLRYGRHFFTTAKGHVGLATPGIRVSDEVAILMGGDVPVVLRPYSDYSGKSRAYQLLCECYVQAPLIMQGEFLRENWTLAEDIVLL